MPSGNYILQSGNVTPGHLWAVVTDGVAGDAGVTFNNTLGLFRSDVLGINFNAANSDNPISINLPVGFTKYRIDRIVISGASGTLSTAGHCDQSRFAMDRNSCLKIALYESKNQGPFEARGTLTFTGRLPVDTIQFGEA